jgi:DNA-binding response OmpR family regulator
LADPATTPGGRSVAGGAVLVLADDLIWASRLAEALTAAGATPRRVRRVEDLQDASLAIIDLTARAYDGVAAIRAARDAGARVVAVGQHDDAALRRAALDAGAERVFTYRALFEGGAKLLGAWLAR